MYEEFEDKIGGYQKF